MNGEGKPHVEIQEIVLPVTGVLGSVTADDVAIIALLDPVSAQNG
jgi:hypothetical protein